MNEFPSTVKLLALQTRYQLVTFVRIPVRYDFRPFVRLLPPYVRRFYQGVFRELPPEAPSPERLAPHR